MARTPLRRGHTMRLSAFIQANLPPILVEWDLFARTLFPVETGKTGLALRDHAQQILEELAADMQTAQSAQQQAEKSKGQEPDGTQSSEGKESAAAIHGTLRQYIGYTLVQVAAEFRALRATVLRLWLKQITHVTEDMSYDMIRFNEAVDQALAESVQTYTERTSRARDTFLAILGHDLRSPLTAIALAGHYLKSPTVGTEGTQKAGTRIVTSAAGMSAMVNDLLEYGRNQLGGEMPIERQLVDVKQICLTALEEAQGAHPDFEFDLKATGEAVDQFDGSRLQQVFGNLLNNAAQYGDKAHPIHLIVEGRPDFVVVQVCNLGPVIPAESLQAIFDPLVQLGLHGQKNSPFSNSSGLGLFIAREISASHGGVISVESSKEFGTIFTVRLPRSPYKL